MFLWNSDAPNAALSISCLLCGNAVQCLEILSRSGACSYLSVPQLLNRFYILAGSDMSVLFLISKTSHHIIYLDKSRATLNTQVPKSGCKRCLDLCINIDPSSAFVNIDPNCLCLCCPKPRVLAQQAVTSASISTEALTARSTSANAGIPNQAAACCDAQTRKIPSQQINVDTRYDAKKI